MEIDSKKEKLELIQKWMDEAEAPTLHDCRWMMDEIRSLRLKVSEQEESLLKLREMATKLNASNVVCRHTLTLWLAVRGSNSEEFFAATKALAHQTTKAIND